MRRKGFVAVMVAHGKGVKRLIFTYLALQGK
jgi:hypothetical protein